MNDSVLVDKNHKQVNYGDEFNYTCIHNSNRTHTIVCTFSGNYTVWKRNSNCQSINNFFSKNNLQKLQ